MEATPANALSWIAAGIGYSIHVSVNTYSKDRFPQSEVMLYIHQIVREDAHLLYGFFSKEERTSVPGIDFRVRDWREHGERHVEFNDGRGDNRGDTHGECECDQEREGNRRQDSPARDYRIEG